MDTHCRRDKLRMQGLQKRAEGKKLNLNKKNFVITFW